MESSMRDNMRWHTKKSPQRHVSKPNGPYVVGCTDVMTSYSQNDGVFFRLFYPAMHVQNAKCPDWLPDEKYLEGYAIFFKIWPPLFCKSFPKFVGNVHVPAAWNAPPLQIENKKFPVVVFSHGLGGCRTSYTTLCLELASNGFVVAALEHRDYSASNSFYFLKHSQSEDENGNCTSFRKFDSERQKCQLTTSQSDVTKHWMCMKKVKTGKGEYAIRNKQVHQRAEECSSALDLLSAINNGEPVENVLPESSPNLLRAFASLLDMSRATIAGHSFGGATVIATMASDKRFCAGIGLDTWMLPLQEETSIFQKVDQPMLFINMEKFQTKRNLKVMKKLVSTQVERTITTLKGTVHLNQCDVPFLCDRTMRRLFGAHSKLDRFVAMDLTTNLSMEFLRKHLALASSPEHSAYIQNHQKVLIKGIR